MDNPSVKLCYPIKIDGKSVDLLTFRRMRVSDLRAAFAASGNGKDELQLSISLALRLNMDGMSPDVLDSMDGSDWIAVQTLIQAFLSPTSGAAASV